MAVNISLLGGAAAQFFDGSGNPLTAGKVYTYAAGTTTPQTAYTTSAGNVAHTNPIILDSAGRVPFGGEIWLTDSISYKFVIANFSDVVIGTYDNVLGSGSGILANLLNNSDPTKGDALVGFRQSNSGGNLSGSVGSTVHKKLQEIINVRDFGAVGNGVTDDSTAFQNAIDAIASAESGVLMVPPGTFYIGTSLDLASNIQIVGAGKGITTLKGAPRTTPNGATVSSNILTGDSLTNVVLKDMTFDGGIYGPSYTAGNGPPLALVDFESCTNVTVENCNLLGFIYSDNGSINPATNTYKLGALFAFDSSYITIKNVEYVSPTYGNLIMFIECTHVMIDGAKSIFTNTGTNIINETPLNIWGDDCQYVTIQNCEFANNYGSAINLGGQGSFIIKNNRFYDTAPGGGGIDLTNETWVSVNPPDMYNVIIDGNTFTNVEATCYVGDIRQSQAISSHEIIITNNTYQMTSGGTPGGFLVGNSDFARIANNSFNGAKIQLNYNNICTVEGNTLYGRQESALGGGIELYCRSATVDSYQYIRNNVISDFEKGAFIVRGFFAAPYTNIVYSDNEMLYTGVYTPTNGQYVTVIPSGGNPAYIPGDFTITQNRLNGLTYVPFTGTDTEIYATKFYFGALSTKVGSFTRDMTTASGTQAVTGVGFRPKAVMLIANQANEPEVSIGIASQNNLSANNTNAGSVFSRYATAAGDWSSSNTSAIYADQSTGDYGGVVSSLDDDGFTITWTKTSLPTGTLNVYYLAIQ